MSPWVHNEADHHRPPIFQAFIHLVGILRTPYPRNFPLSIGIRLHNQHLGQILNGVPPAISSEIRKTAKDALIAGVCPSTVSRLHAKAYFWSSCSYYFDMVPAKLGWTFVSAPFWNRQAALMLHWIPLRYPWTTQTPSNMDQGNLTLTLEPHTNVVVYKPAISLLKVTMLVKYI